MNNPWYRLSPYVLPHVRQGLHNLTPQNMCDGAVRIDYAENLLRHIRHMLAHGDLEGAKLFHNHAPWGKHYVMWQEDAETGKVTVEAVPEMHNALSLRPAELGVLLVDGRTRDDSEMAYLPSGEGTAALLGLLRLLHRGIQRDAFLTAADTADVGFDEELLDALIARGAVEITTGPVPARPIPAQAAMTWLGHAYVQASAGGKAVWFDPYPMPRMTWTETEVREQSDADLPDKFLLENYGPHAHHVTQDELPIPDAIFVTHQDMDHLDLGAVALLPDSVPIYVPAHDPSMPWQVDMVHMIHTILGPTREVRVMRHGDVVTLGDIRVTAFPFVGEFPVSLPHQWNCFFVELPNQVWAMCADSAITQGQIDTLRDLLKDNLRPFGIMTNGMKGSETSAGYRDLPGEAFSGGRLYSWYLPPYRMFERGPESGLPVPVLPRLVKECRLGRIYPYAHGNLPWYRLQGTYLLASHIGSHSMQLWHQMEHIAQSHGVTIERLQHGKPYSPGQLGPLPRQLKR